MNKMFGFIANRFYLPIVSLCGYYLWQKQTHIGFKRVYLMDSNTVEEALTKIVKLSIANKDLWEVCRYAKSGTACIVDIKSNSHIYLITCAHVVDQVVNLSLMDNNNIKIGYGRVLLTDPEFDLAIVVARVAVSAGSTLKSAKYADAMFADQVMSIGVPISAKKFPNWSPGIIICPVSLLARDVVKNYVHHYDVANRVMIESSAEMVPGMSGGAIVNMLGEFVGYPCIGNLRYKHFLGGQGCQIYRMCEMANKFANNRTAIRLRDHSIGMGLRMRIMPENNRIFIYYQIIMPSIGNEQLQINNIKYGIIEEINGQPIESFAHFIHSIYQTSAIKPCVVNIEISSQLLTRNIWLDNDTKDMKFV